MTNNQLKEGSSGEDVTLLQQLLRINNYSYASTTGVFGPDTTIYVKDFQKDNNLEVTGIFNKDDWEKIYEITTPKLPKTTNNKPLLKLGDNNEYVKELQIILTSLSYYNKVINGIFSKDVENSVKSFQYINKLIPDGIVGSNTWNALDILYTPLEDCLDDNSITYIVQKGDTLYSISKRFNISVNDLINTNNLTSTNLSINQELIIPNNNNTNDTTYIVQKGDTLYSISKRFSVSVNDLINTNNLTSTTLSINQELIIPNNNNTNDTTYTVQKGDTLYSISKKFNTTIDNLSNKNNLSTNILTIGQILTI